MVNILNDNKKKTKSDYKNTPREELIREISKAEDAKTEEEKEARKNAYAAYVSQVTPTYSLPLNMLKAFLEDAISEFHYTVANGQWKHELK